MTLEFCQLLQLEIAWLSLTCPSVSFPTANQLLNHFKLLLQPVFPWLLPCLLPLLPWSCCLQLLFALLPRFPTWPSCFSLSLHNQPAHLLKHHHALIAVHQPLPPAAFSIHSTFSPPHTLCSTLTGPLQFPGHCVYSCYLIFAGVLSSISTLYLNSSHLQQYT